MTNIKPIVVTVLAQAVCDASQLHEDDQVVAETARYTVSLRPDTPANLIASAALDGFHENFGIRRLDDFVFSVKDAAGANLAEPKDASGYENGHYVIDVFAE